MKLVCGWEYFYLRIVLANGHTISFPWLSQNFWDVCRINGMFTGVKIFSLRAQRIAIAIGCFLKKHLIN